MEEVINWEKAPSVTGGREFFFTADAPPIGRAWVVWDASRNSYMAQIQESKTGKLILNRPVKTVKEGQKLVEQELKEKGKMVEICIKHGESCPLCGYDEGAYHPSQLRCPRCGSDWRWSVGANGCCPLCEKEEKEEEKEEEEKEKMTDAEAFREIMDAWNTILSVARQHYPAATDEEIYQITRGVMDHALTTAE